MGIPQGLLVRESGVGNRESGRPYASRRATFTYTLMAIVTFSSGCVLPDKFCLHRDTPCPPVCQIGAAWSNYVDYAADPTHGGTPAPGLSGRLYLFGATPDYPFIGDGSLVVDLYDDTVRPGEAATPGGKQLEQWQFDPVTLKRLAKKDAIGDGYTLFLPWGTYRPDIKTIHLVTRYEPVVGTPVYAPNNPLLLEHGTPPPGALSPK